MSREVILGVNCFAHDAAACLVDAQTGEVIFAIAEERLSNIKHESHFPIGAIDRSIDVALKTNLHISCVSIGSSSDILINNRIGDHLSDIDVDVTRSICRDFGDVIRYEDYYHIFRRGFVSDYMNYVLKERISAEHLDRVKRICSFGYNWAVKLKLAKTLISEKVGDIPIVEVPHHTAHAAAAYLSSGFDRAAVLVVDGQGEAESVSMFSGHGSQLSKLSSSLYPNSLGLLYLYATYHLGFGFGDEYKVMGMAAYGQPRYIEEFSTALHVDDAGTLRIVSNELFEIVQGPFGTAHVSIRFLPRIFDVFPARQGGEPIEQHHFDFAASIQAAVETAGVKLASAALRTTGEQRLIVTGGVALNGLMNERIRKTAGCERLFVYPASGDDGTAVGAAQWLAMSRGAYPERQMRTSFLGGGSDRIGIEQAIARYDLSFERPADIHAAVAEAISSGMIVARFVGRSEFGPRALGNRSILADPRSAGMKDILNQRIKHRENFRPFAPACLLERAQEFFDVDGDSPFMLLICRLKEGAGSIIPAVAHHDGTARVQTVERCSNPDLHRTISAFASITGVPVLINTSFNVNGEAIVETALDAVESFLFMDIDCLAIDDLLIWKRENVNSSLSHLPVDEYLDLRRARFREEFPGPSRHLDMSLFFDALT